MAQDRRAMIRAAEKMVGRGKLETAIKQYRKVLRATPDDTGTLNRVGDLYARLDRLDEAVEIFSRAADHFISEGFLVKAIAIFKKIIRLDPTRISVYETLADLYHRQGLRNEARSQYQVVADYYQQAGDAEKARSIFERMVELEPNNPSHKVKLAEHYCEADMIPEAMDQYQLIASFMLEHSRVDEALRVYRGAFDLSPTDLGFLTDVVLHLVDGGHPDAAKRLLSQAIQVNPDAERVRKVTGLTLEVEEERRGQGSAEAVMPGTRAPAAAPPVVEEAAGEISGLEGSVVEGQVGDTAAEEAPEIPPLEVDDELLSLIEEESQATDSEVEAEIEDVAAESTTDDAVLVLDLEADATELPFAVESVLPARSTDEQTDELEIDLDGLEEELPPLVEEEVPALAGDLGEQPVVVGEVEATATVESEEISKVSIEELLDLGEAQETGADAEVDEPGEESITEPVEEPIEKLLPPPVEPPVEPSVEAVEEPQPAGAAEVPTAEELLTEARVLVNYGLDGKAVELCERALDVDSEVYGAFGLLIEILHNSDEGGAAAECAMRARAVLGEESGQWLEIEERLQESGYRVSPELVEAPVGSEPVAAESPAPEPVESEPPIVEQTSPGWLEEDSSGEQSFAEEEGIFGSEDDFFDLAAELEQELSREEEELSGEFIPQLQEQSLEEIVEGFKRGVAETLSEEDYETHYNLGIAYREMGLLDEAIGEFQLAAKAPGYLVDCCSLLGACFLEKGFPDLAIKWFERGLEAPDVSENESLGLLYELGNLYLITGDKDVARKTFADIYGVNSNYRDVVAKLEELKVS